MIENEQKKCKFCVVFTTRILWHFIIHVTSKYPACYCRGGKTDRQHTDIRLYVFCSFFMFTVVKLVQNMNLWLPHSPARPTDRLPTSVLIFFCEHCRLRGVVRFSNPEGLIEIDCIFPLSVLFSESLNSWGRQNTSPPSFSVNIADSEVS